MTAISAINDHYGLKLFSTPLCVHTVGKKFSQVMSNCKESFGEGESLSIWEHQVANTWSESPVFSPLSWLLPLP